jgi:hypothetical protein
VTTEPATNDYSDYCRQLEAFLCQRNGGHLIRIAGPAFDQVRGWAEQGVPLQVAFRGIDRYLERSSARGSRRRPVRIEFCEADILELFDDWRRAVGVTRSAPEASAAKKPALAAHLERAVARLIARRAPRSPAFEQQVEAVLAELDRLSAAARNARGEARAAIIERLASLDRELMQAAIADLDSDSATVARREAEAELAPFAARMAPDAHARGVEAAFERLVRESLGLPTIVYR